MGTPGSTRQTHKSEDISPEAVLRAVIETSDDGIFTCNHEGTITAWSATAERLSGYRATEILEATFDLVLPVHLRGDFRSVIARVLAGDRIRHFETELLRPDGMPIPLSLSLCPVFGSDQAPVGAVVIARDITEQRLTQAALAEAETRLQEGEALAHVGNWLWDLRTGTVQWSAEFHRIHGVAPVDFVGTLAAHLGMVHPDDLEKVRTEMELAITAARPFEREYRIVRSDREVRILHVRAQPTIGSEGAALGLWGIGQDVTDCRPADPAR